ncbi:MAG TPA: GNAT family N-acetyltransferase [Pseudonocardiaceae bacterium]|jgi:RimJ/RimL family protein N-acetyltransferase|nr:GNAT family N-acetyltransferase [Pseudonocardiaceae bacterium]
MDPVEINAGSYYLRQLRADDLIDDRETLRAFGFADPDAHIAGRSAGWQADTAYTWAIADPPTGTLLGEVGLASVDRATGHAEAICWVAVDQRGHGIAGTVLGSVLRFGFGALDLRAVDYSHPPSDTAAARVAEKLGWHPVEPAEAHRPTETHPTGARPVDTEPTGTRTDDAPTGSVRTDGTRTAAALTDCARTDGARQTWRATA